MSSNEVTCSEYDAKDSALLEGSEVLTRDTSLEENEETSLALNIKLILG